MRVLIAPDTFDGALSAVQAARAIAEGWSRSAPDDELDLVPMGDGGPGLVEVLHASLGGDLLGVTVTGPYGEPVPGSVLLVHETAYVEGAQACGLHLTPEVRRHPERAGSRGVGELVAAALDTGARTVVVGVAGAGSNDGGAGLLAALVAVCEPAGALESGADGLAALVSVDPVPARDRVGDVRLVVAGDAEGPLLGLTGTTSVSGPRRGVAPDRLQAVDALLERLAGATDRAVARQRGAGAGGGIGFALLLLGATHASGVATVTGAVDLPGHAARADLVVTGEGAFDFAPGSGTVPRAVAAVAARALRPCIGLATRVHVGSRELRTWGIESAYASQDLVGEEASLADPGGSLSALAERTARTWSR